jgi:imidazolonepropionase-like amidohydrolase
MSERREIGPLGAAARRRIGRRSALGLGALAAVAWWGRDAVAQPADRVALVGARLYRSGEPELPDAVVVVDRGRIESIGSDRGRAQGARQIDVTGKLLTAGLVDLLTRTGAEEVSLEPSTRDDAVDPARTVCAAFQAADGYNPQSSLVPIARTGGLTSVGVVPTAGLVMGQSAWVDLAGATAAEAIATRSLALHVRLQDAAIGDWDHNTATAMLLLRELLDDGRLYRANRAAFDRRQLRRLAHGRLDYEVVARVLGAELPLVVHVDRASDILAVLALAAANQLRLVLASCAEAWKVADAIAKAKVPCIVYPLDHGPRSFAALGAREDNAALLHQAGVTVVLSTGESHNARKLRQEAGNAVRAGLPHAAALDAVTAAPAAALGMSDYGSPAPGRAANLVVWSDDPFELSTRVELVMIRGQLTSLRTRQTALLERYR